MSTANDFKVLLIEPCDDTGTLLALLLEMYGCIVKIEKKFLDACASLTTFQPHVILTELDGVEDLNIAEKLKQMPQGKNAQVVALTSQYWIGIEAELSKAGFMHYMLKPASLESIVSKLTEIAEMNGFSLADSHDEKSPLFLSPTA